MNTDKRWNEFIEKVKEVYMKVYNNTIAEVADLIDNQPWTSREKIYATAIILQVEHGSK